MLLDTSGLFCLFHQAELFHQDACRVYFAANRRMTHNLIIAEFVALANARRLPRAPSLQFVDDLIANPDIVIDWIDSSLHHRAMELLRSRLDKSYSLCDAVSFILMKDRQIDEALTSDRHFEQEGFRKLLG